MYDSIPEFLSKPEETIIFQLINDEAQIISIQCETRSLLCNCIIEAQQDNLSVLLKGKLTYRRSGFYTLTGSRIKYTQRPKFFSGHFKILLSDQIRPSLFSELPFKTTWKQWTLQTYLILLHRLGFEA